MGDQQDRRRRGPVLTLLVIFIISGLSPTAPVHAADPARQAQEGLATELGGSPTDFELVHQTAPAPAVAGLGGWAAKLLDRRTGEIHIVHQLADGTIGSQEARDAALDAERAALSPTERKADAPLRAAVAAAAPEEILPVAVWLDVDTTAADAAVVAAHPEVTWVGNRPLADSLEQARALRAELWAGRQGVYAASAESLRGQVEAAGGSVAYVSTSAPLVFVDLPPAAVESVAELGGVSSIGLEGEWRTSMSSAGPTVTADWTSGTGDQGSGVRVAVVEYHNVAATGDLGWTVVASYSTTGAMPTHAHPTWVAGAIASQNATYGGVAPAAGIVSAGTGGYVPGLTADRAVIAAADWAVAPAGGDADVVNVSLGQDTATGAEEGRRYFDSIGWEDGRLVVAASGNLSTFGNWDVVSPGTGYNVLTVGGVNDRGSAWQGDDILWYQPGSNGANWYDRPDAPWNTHGDFNKPNLSAPAVGVRTANGISGDGTSIASPIVAGIAAQLISRAPWLAAVPEATRAIMTAGALERTPMPDGSVNGDHEGAGSAHALWANRVLSAGPYGGYAVGAMHAGEIVVRDVPVVAGQKVRVALAWSSHTSGSSNTGKADVLASDLDLRVVAPNGAVIGSYSFDNSYEVVDLVAPSSGTMRIEVRSARFETAVEPYGLAWALASPFVDAESSLFFADILWIAQQGLTTGCTPGRYCPQLVVTREEMASFLVRALGLPPSGTDYFDDDAGSIHQPDINALAAAGITDGCGMRRYCPKHGVSREEMASFLVRALGLPPSGTDYFDDDAGSMHQAAINALASSGITTGCAARRYCPTAGVMREQMAAFLHRAFD